MITPLYDSAQVDNAFDTFFSFIKNLVNIPLEDQIHCRSLFKPVSVKKDSMLEIAGTIHKHHNFVVSGYLRNYYIDSTGTEVTTDINDGPRFFTSYYHFVHQTVSPENIHCITDCILLRINHEDALTAATTGITSREYHEKVLLFYLEKGKERINELVTKSGKERYLQLLQDNPNIIQNVPLNYISSYLGLNPGSLSRIRQELSK